MIAASQVDVEEKAYKVSIIEVTNTIVDPWAMVVYGGHRVPRARTLRHTYPYVIHIYRCQYNPTPPRVCHLLLTLSTMMSPWWLIILTCSAITRTACELLDFVSAVVSEVWFLRRYGV